MKNLFPIFFSFLMSVLLIACTSERNQDDYSNDEYDVISASLTLPQVVHDYELHLGEHFLPEGKTYPQLNNSGLGDIYKRNNLATLGRTLFYDKNLSSDRTISCGSCHLAERAFSDDGKFSKGVDDVTTRRNTLALATTLSFKISYNPIDPSHSRSKFSWDDSAANLPQQVKNAFNKENEMNIDEDEIIKRVTEQPFYDILFRKTYGDGEVTGDRIAESITAFIDAISSTNSKFDKGLESSSYFSADNNFYNFTEEENRGKAIYNTNCASCHTAKHNFTIKAIANNGLDMVYEDKGIGGRLNDIYQFGVFKVPFLRNIALTAPYMHDGRFETLHEVVDHYSDNVLPHRNLSNELKNADNSVKRLNLSQEDKDALVAYLHTLTDEALISDERFSDPFK